MTLIGIKLQRRFGISVCFDPFDPDWLFFTARALPRMDSLIYFWGNLVIYKKFPLNNHELCTTWMFHVSTCVWLIIFIRWFSVRGKVARASWRGVPLWYSAARTADWTGCNQGWTVGSRRATEAAVPTSGIPFALSNVKQASLQNSKFSLLSYIYILIFSSLRLTLRRPNCL